MAMSKIDELKFHIGKIQEICNDAIEAVQTLPFARTAGEKRLISAIERLDAGKTFRRLSLWYVSSEPEEMDDDTQKAMWDVLFLLNEIIESREEQKKIEEGEENKN